MNRRVGRASRLPGVGEADGIPARAFDGQARRLLYVGPLRFVIPMHVYQRKTAFHTPGLVWSSAFRRYARGPDRLKPELQAVSRLNAEP